MSDGTVLCKAGDAALEELLLLFPATDMLLLHLLGHKGSALDLASRGGQLQQYCTRKLL